MNITMYDQAAIYKWRMLSASLASLLLFCLLGNSLPVAAQESASGVTEIRTLDSYDAGIVNPSGLTYSPQADIYFVLQADVADQPTVYMMTPFDEPAGSVDIAGLVADPINMAFDAHANRLLILDSATGEIVALIAAADGRLDPDATPIQRYQAGNLGLQEPKGMVVDAATGEIYILDSVAGRVLRMTPSADSGLDGQTAVDEGRLSWIDLKLDRSAVPQGLALDPGDGRLLVASPANARLYRLTESGNIFEAYDLSTVDLADSQGIVVAPTATPSDDPSHLSLFVADTGLPQGTPGQVVEISLSPTLSAAATNVVTVPATLVNTTDMSIYSTPSSDPSGLAYLPHMDSLLVSDGEINEIDELFQGYNLFRVAFSGALIEPLTIFPTSDEPTGVGRHPGNGHLFFSDDTGSKVSLYELNPGGDGQYNTADDSVSSLPQKFDDAEGVAVHPDAEDGNDYLYVAGGVDDKIYKINLGDGSVADFDTGPLGISDPEGVEYDPESGLLYIIGNQDFVAETTIDGTLVRKIDFTSVDAIKTAGITLAPPSSGSGDWHIYIVDRNVDNDNDGLLYEISYELAPSLNEPPTVAATADLSTVELSAIVNLNGAVSDDGKPAPPALTTLWEKVSGPGTVTFGNAALPSTTATFMLTGTYELRLTANDTVLSTSDEVTIHAYQAGGNQVPTVNAGADQTVSVSASLTGTVTDSDVPSAATSTWSKVSGPAGIVTFANAALPTTTATFSTNGTYVLKLEAVDGPFTVSDEITVTVVSNVPPTVNVGLAQNVLLPASVTLAGTASDDGLPGGTLTTTWSQFSAPPSGGTASFSDAGILAPIVSFDLPGRYVLRLTANDGDLATSHDVIIDASTNQPPVVNAGATQTVGLTGGAALAGTATDDGWPTGVVTTTWSQFSGTGTATFANTAALSTTVRFDAVGDYVLRLTASDGLLSSFHDVTISVVPNQPPTANAGADQTVSGSATLTGVVSDDGLPSPTLTSTWSQVSGPGTATFADATALATTVSFDLPGAYLLRLSTYDGDVTATDDIAITVEAVNQAPTVNAGADQTIDLAGSATLQGTVTDDGLPNPPALSTTWRKVSGPGAVTFADASAMNTTATFDQAGVYVLQLAAGDGEFTTNATVTVTVQGVNQAPTVDAGPDQSIGLADSATLQGTVSDDGLPAPSSVSTTWSKVSGPGAVTFADASAMNTTATFDQAGVYVLQLAAGDGEFTTNATVTVTVQGVNQAPSVDTGTDQTIGLAGSATLQGTVTDDGLPTPTALQATWSQVSGPGTVTFDDAYAAETTASFDAEGTYVLLLSAGDGEFMDSDTVTIIVASTNQAPAVDAGEEQVVVVLPDGITLNGTITDDGLPNGAPLAAWIQIDGPGTVTFDDSSAPATTASFSEAGTYVLQLAASDGEFIVSDDIRVVVYAAGQAPAPTLYIPLIFTQP